ncbi:MAG TPA: alpha/beta fold hydrolase, partial [Gemmatimonadales bacterium]|nr:alpha/beta fold hydrolase [Gemmatimonadales bacterium]
GSTLEPDRCALYQRFFQSERHAHDVLTMMADWSLTELRADLPRVPCPVHLVAGRRDHWVPLRLLRRLSRSIPHCTFTELGGGHLHHEESPAEAAALIERAARTAGLL